MTWQQRDYYDLLEVERDATPKEINTAYRLQMQAWAPDKWTRKISAQVRAQVNERAQAINEANEELGDPDRRRRYDATLPPQDDDIAPFPERIQNVPSVWMRMSHWMTEEDVGSGSNHSFAYNAGKLLAQRLQPSELQIPYMLEAWKIAIDAGFDPLEDDMDENDG